MPLLLSNPVMKHWVYTEKEPLILFHTCWSTETPQPITSQTFYTQPAKVIMTLDLMSSSWVDL